MKLIKLFTITLFGSMILFGCQPPSEVNSGTDENAVISGVEESETLVRIVSLERTEIARTIDYNANLEAYEEAYIAPATPGRIDKLYVEPGDRVKKGQKLFLMDQTQLYQTKIQLQSMAVDLKRMEALLETGSTTQQAYDQLKTQYDVTDASLQFLTDNTMMVAPFAGIITGKYYENGEIYSGAPNTQAGKASVVTLMQVNPLKAVLNISEVYYPMVKNGMSAKVGVDVFIDEEFKGEVILVYPTIDAMTRSFKVEVKVPNSSNRLKPGMFARVSMLVGEERAFIVPANTVLQQEGTNIRYLFVEENGVARRYNVIIGKRYDEKVEIISEEIAEGAKIVVDGQTKLMDGDKIKVVN